MNVKAKQVSRNLLNALCSTSENVTNLQNTLLTLFAPEQLPTNRFVVTGAGADNIADGFKSFTISNIGSADASLNGQTLPAGITETYSATSKNETVEGMPYDALTSTLIIITIG